MLKKLLKVATLVSLGYVVYDQLNKYSRNIIRVEEISTDDILEMLEEKNFKMFLGFNDKVLHFIKEDKSEAIQARVDENNEVFLIEYYKHQAGVKTLENVYPENVVLDNKNAEKARIEFLRMLGSIGVTEKRFNKLVSEVLIDSKYTEKMI